MFLLVHDQQGLSPHTRGKPPDERGADLHRGPIPAYAGETLGGTNCETRSRAYPRIRGGNILVLTSFALDTGLSPHTRGKRLEHQVKGLCAGPIPAYAGETPTSRHLGKTAGAYPRIRGGNQVGLVAGGLPEGLSPHTRGKRALSFQKAHTHGPIPAYAGET